MSLLELFCDIDDFWQAYEPIWHQSLLESEDRCRRRTSRMCMSELMTIVVHFHQKRFGISRPTTRICDDAFADRVSVPLLPTPPEQAAQVANLGCHPSGIFTEGSYAG